MERLECPQRPIAGGIEIAGGGMADHEGGASLATAATMPNVAADKATLENPANFVNFPDDLGDS